MTENSVPVPSVRRQIAIWLFCLCGFVGLVVLVGGMTRLTDSGLSITEWKPVTGVIPPMSAESWEQEFFKYRQIPEFQQTKRDMTLDAFKTIYWWEWGHRLLARLAGLVFLLPFLYFWLVRKLPRVELPQFGLLFLMGAGQGALGWFMVQSGLSVRVDVSQYRLAAHLGLAFLVYGYSLWLGLNYWRGAGGIMQVVVPPVWLRWSSALLAAAIFLQVLLGALVAGLDAGLTYNSWPLMDGYWLPPGMTNLRPAYLNLFENITLVQFNHRGFAAVIALSSATLWWKTRDITSLGRAPAIILWVIIAQFTLGVWTLLAVSPVSLSAAHQLGALISYSAAIYLAHRVFKPVLAIKY